MVTLATPFQGSLEAVLKVATGTADLGADDPHGNTWGRRLPGVEEWTPPLPLREKDGPGDQAP